MTKKPMPKSGSEGYVGQPQSTPMPEYPIPGAPVLAMPMPTRMPVQNTSSVTSTQRPTNESKKVIAMDGYPTGRGGMRMVPVAFDEQSAQHAVRPGAPIGARPPAMKMPTNP